MSSDTVIPFLPPTLRLNIFPGTLLNKHIELVDNLLIIRSRGNKTFDE